MKTNQIPLSKFDLIMLPQALELLAQNFGLRIEPRGTPVTATLMEESEFLVTQGEWRILKDSQEVGALRVFPWGTDLEVQRHQLFYALEISGAEGDLIEPWSQDLGTCLKSALPKKFVSMEHLLHYFREGTEIHAYQMAENFLPSYETVIQDHFAGLESLGFVTFKNKEGAEEFGMRIEIRENEFRLVRCRRFQIFKQDHRLFALGIQSTAVGFNVKYGITVYCEKSEGPEILKLFGEDFEKRLFKHLEIQGGKFLGNLQLLKNQEKLTMDDIVLDPAVRRRVEQEVLGFFDLEEVYKKAGIPFKRGVAIYGPPGTGKTMFAKILAHTLSQTLIWVKAEDVSDGQGLSRIFTLARLGAPSVIIFEDADFYTQDRSAGSGRSSVLATLMAELDGLESNPGIMVILTSNRLEVIEGAVANRPGRVDTKIHFGDLGVDEVETLMNKKIGHFARDFPSFKSVLPSHFTASGAVVQEMVTLIMRHTLQGLGPQEEIRITQETMRKVLREWERMEKRSVGFSQ